MNLARAISFCVCANLSIAVAYGCLKAVRALEPRLLLKMHNGALVLVLTIPIAMQFVPRDPFFQPPAKVWAAPSLNMTRDIPGDLSPGASSGFIMLANTESDGAIDTASLCQIATGTFALLLLAAILFFIRDARNLIRILKTSNLIRKIGRVHIYVDESVSVPFSFRSLRAAHVIIPTNLVAKPVEFRIAVLHELQHHRQHDTKTIYALWILRLFCIANPFVHLWARELSEIQEFACDETLINLGKVDSQAYARCLFEVAKTANDFNGVPVCATGFAFKTEGSLLKRRIRKMFHRNITKQNRYFGIIAALAISLIMTLAAYASSGLVQDRRISMEQAEKMLEKFHETGILRQKSASTTPSFPLVMNDRVLRQLNRYLGTNEGRDFMKAALARMDVERATIEKVMQKYGVPRELLAMPIIESGFENLPMNPTSKSKAAGLWQFIPRTAQIYGLRVELDDRGRLVGRDERTSTALETDAAMRLLVAGKMRFQDWMLSVSAYNAGEERVQEGIDKTASRDPWTLVGRGFEGDHDYLAKLTAAILIMNSPDSVL